MKHETILKVGQESKIQTEGTFLYIDAADGEIVVTTQSGLSYSLNRWDQIQLPSNEVLGEISVRNTHSEANHLLLRTGYGKFFATGQAGSSFAVITDMPNIEFAGIQTVNVNNLPSEQAVNVGNFPAEQAVNVGNFPAEQTVNVNNFPTVQAVAVNSLPAINVVNGATYSPLAKANFTDGDYVIHENLTRKSIGFKVSPFNTGVIWIGTGIDNGIPLFAGESIELSTTDAINLHAENLADNCYLSEVIY